MKKSAEALPSLLTLRAIKTILNFWKDEKQEDKISHEKIIT